ncbi:hypothetical protein VTI74DRAFT_7061 [Chaetomium olivicolor]
MESGLILVPGEPESPVEHPERQDNQADFEPCTFFVYGTLMDPEVLMVVAGLDHRPELKDAWIEGFKLKMWKGIYPVLLPGSPQSRIKGKVWQAITMDQCLRLQQYETSAYEPTDCQVHVGESNSEPVKGLVFMRLCLQALGLPMPESRATTKSQDSLTIAPASSLDRVELSLRERSRSPSVNRLGLSLVHASHDPAADLIFVHGLGGTSHGTWSWKRDPDNFWPNWLAQDAELTRCRICTFKYNADFKQDTASATIEFSKDLLLRMKTYSGPGTADGNAIGTYPIIFVMHSMGGLVVKKAYIIGRSDIAQSGNSFKLLFSFDYAGNGLWDKTDVIALINTYAPHAAYYRRGSQPLVSIFEGPTASADWPDIKTATGCFFIPSWSSLGAGPAWAKGTADGLFSWVAWPEGPKSMSTFTDNSYRDALGSAPYMMPVSPWFYTNMPGFRKNWLWRGDELWFDRWVHVMTLQPAYVQIISWNGYSECYHIEPLLSNAYTTFDAAHGRAPFNYALNKPHDGWRTFLPFLIDMAKTNTTSFNQENVVAWYREQPASACGTGGTTGNTASQLQTVYPPCCTSPRPRGHVIAGTWTITPSGGAGLYRGSVPTGGRIGSVVVTITRLGASLLSATGNAITTSCPGGITNWNANIIVGTPQSIASVSPLSLSNSICTSGFGDPKYLDLCKFACKYGYCLSVCTCTSLGAAITKPTALGVNGCPKPGVDSTHLGLCSFGCDYGSLGSGGGAQGSLGEPSCRLTATCRDQGDPFDSRCQANEAKLG